MLRALLVSLLALAPLADASHIVVPTDQPDLEAALAVAAPGDVIIVRTDADQASHNWPYTLVIDKPVTIIGEPVCNIRIYDQTPKGFELKGPGHGEVTLSRIDLRYFTPDSGGSPSVFGGGFHALHLYDCSIQQDNGPYSGMLTSSFPAVDLTDVSRLTVVDSDLLGGRAGTDSFCIPASSNYVDGMPGIRAPQSAVFLLDSTVVGGTGGDPAEVTWEPCAADMRDFGGSGGHGVVAGAVYATNSTVTGGTGVRWYSDPINCSPDSPSAIDCGKQPDGMAFIVSGNLANDLCSRLTQATSTPTMGGSLDLTWDPTSTGCQPDAAALVGATALLAIDLSAPTWPTAIGNGWLFVDLNRAMVATGFPADAYVNVLVSIPATPSLVGMPYTAQVLVGATDISGPATGRIAP